jgi:hypothetical protein
MDSLVRRCRSAYLRYDRYHCATTQGRVPLYGSDERVLLTGYAGIFCCMSESGRPRWLRRWGGAVFAALCAGAAFVAQTLPGEHLSTWTRWAITLGGAAATMVALLLAARPTSADRGAREDAEKLATTAVTDYHIFTSVLQSLLLLSDRIITAPNEIGRIEAKGAIKQAVVNSSVQFAGALGTRSRYFDYEPGVQENKLICRDIYSGWDPRPRTEFSSADPNHTEIFQLLESRQSGLIEGVDIENPPRFPLMKRGHKTYMAVPVATSTEIFGLLTLDTLHACELNTQGEKKILLLAQLLGIALASGGDGRRGSTNNIIAVGGQRFARLVHSVIRCGNGTS